VTTGASSTTSAAAAAAAAGDDDDDMFATVLRIVSRHCAGHRGCHCFLLIRSTRIRRFRSVGVLKKKEKKRRRSQPKNGIHPGIIKPQYTINFLINSYRDDKYI
jgi:hypothetical protein